MTCSAIQRAGRQSWGSHSRAVLRHLAIPRTQPVQQYRRSSTRNNEPTASEQIIFSGIQPTGVPHLGNYLGAILPWVELQKRSSPSTKLFYSIVDLHSLTSHQPAEARITSRRNLLASFLATGLDPQRCILFFQSAVPAHVELHWILSCTASMSVLARMTQWKTKLAEQGGVEELLSQSANPRNMERLKLGLFSYPVLQAADILVHKATHVPVGEDQSQHVEFARTCAQAFNHAYCRVDETSLPTELLRPPHVVTSQVKRVMSLTEPEKKMSKSHENGRSRILITDSDADIHKKFRSALTDSMEGISYDKEQRPGVSNLLEIIAHLEGIPIIDVVKDFEALSLRALKERASGLVVARFAPIREVYHELIVKHNVLDDIARKGAEKANASAEATMQQVRRAVGL